MITYTYKDLRGFDSRARELIKEVQEAGWKAVRTGKHGLILFPPDAVADESGYEGAAEYGQSVKSICIPKNLSAPRMARNVMAPFRRWQAAQPTPVPQEEPTMPACVDCGKSFETKQQVVVHHNMVHKLKPCPECGTELNATNMTRHKAHHEQERQKLADLAERKWQAEHPHNGREVADMAAALTDWLEPARTPVDTLAAIRQLVAPELIKRVAELELLLENERSAHKKELEECAAKLDLIKSVL